MVICVNKEEGVLETCWHSGTSRKKCN